MQCFNDRQLKLYLHGAIPGKEIAEMAEHIRSCASCREKLAALSEYKCAAWSINDAVLAAEGCPEYEELSAFVDEFVSHETHQWIERHLSTCEYCTRDIETLQAARSRASLAPQITVRPGLYGRPRQYWNIFNWKNITATAGSIAAVTAVFLVYNYGQVEKPPIVAKNPDKPKVVAVNPNENQPKVIENTNANAVEVPKEADKPTPVVEKEEQPVPVPTPSAPEKPMFVAEVLDNIVTVGKVEGKLVIKPNGKDLEAQIAALVEKKVKTGSVPSSYQIASASAGRLRGPRDVIKVEDMSPSLDAIADSNTSFNWQHVDGATKYRLEVYESDGTPVMHIETEDASYNPTQKLPGGFYKWRIMVRRGEMAEWESSEAASFRVLSDKDADLLNRAKRDYKDSHLVLGTVYETLGMYEEAVKEFSALQAQNPKSEIAANMLHGAKSKLKD